MWYSLRENNMLKFDLSSLLRRKILQVKRMNGVLTAHISNCISSSMKSEIKFNVSEIERKGTILRFK